MNYYKIISTRITGEKRKVLYFDGTHTIDDMLHQYFDIVLNKNSIRGAYACHWRYNKGNGDIHYIIGFRSLAGTMHKTVDPIYIEDCTKEEYVENKLLDE